MAFVRFNVNISGEKQLVRRLQNVESKLGDFSEANEAAYLQWWIPKVRRTFAGDNSWKPLTRDYAAEKAKRYGTKPINRRTDRLYFSLTGQTKDTVKEIGKYSAVFGSKVPYFKYVNELRPIVETNMADRRQIGDIFKRNIEKVVR